MVLHVGVGYQNIRGVHRQVRPDDEGRVLLTRSEAAWLARVTTETLRRWTDTDRTLPIEGQGRNARISWDVLRSRVAADGNPLTHWSWLNADMTHAHGHTPSAATGDDGLARLRDENAKLRADRDAAIADAENLDQAVMAYRDNWRRRVEPQSPKGL